MWFLVHCYEDQGKIEDALNMCEDVIQIVSNFGGEGLGQQHKLWQSLMEKKEELLKLKEQDRNHDIADGAGVSSSRLPTSSSAIPPKKVVKDFTF
jgi:hypothetical protein